MDKVTQLKADIFDVLRKQELLKQEHVKLDSIRIGLVKELEELEAK